MKQDNETKIKLLSSAREEFMEKGYAGASLRNICKKAGVTTGALYFFFQDKAALFEALVKPTMDGIYAMMREHFKEEMQLAVNQSKDLGGEKDYEVSFQIVRAMYTHREDILLVLTKSHGSGYENIADQFVEEAEKHYRMLADEMQKDMPQIVMNDNFIHWTSHMQVDAFIYMITHIENEAEAALFMKQFVHFMLCGWMGMRNSKDTLNKADGYGDRNVFVEAGKKM